MLDVTDSDKEYRRGDTMPPAGNMGSCNIAFIAKADGFDELFVCVILHANEKNSLPKNRFRVDKETMDIAVKYKDRSFDAS